MVYESGGTIEAADYNQLVSDINKIFGTGIGDFGYSGDSTNVPILINLPEVLGGASVDNQNWLDLRNAINDCAEHQGTTLTDGLPSVSDIEDGDIAAFFPRLASPQNLFDITDNRFNVNSAFSPVVTNPLTSTRTSPWSTFIQHEFTIKFIDSDHARAFFNLGGSIRISALRTGGSATVQNASWDSILASNSPYIFGREDYFALTSAYEDLRPQISPSFGAYASTNIWTLQARRDDAQGQNAGNGSIIRISSNFLDGNTNPPDNVDGTFTSTIEEIKFNNIFNIQSPIYQTIREVNDVIAASPPPPVVCDLVNSLLFDQANVNYLTRTPAFVGNRRTWTFSTWIKRNSSIANADVLLSGGTSFGDSGLLNVRFLGSGQLGIASQLTEWKASAAIFRDFSAWYHVVISWDTTQPIADNRIKMYVNGTEITEFSFNSPPPLNFEGQISNNTLQVIGNQGLNLSDPIDGYMSETIFVDGQSLIPTNFGKFDNNGDWQPIDYFGLYGINGFRLDYANNSSVATLGTDVSGNGNDWIANNMTVANQTLDNPCNNYATWNPLKTHASATLSNGNLTYTAAGAFRTVSTMAFSSGKWYAEFKISAAAGNLTFGAGDIDQLVLSDAFIGQRSYEWGIDGLARTWNNNTLGTDYPDPSANDVIGLALDMDNGRIWFRNNAGTWLGGGDPAAGTFPEFTGLNGSVAFAAQTSIGNIIMNTGQSAFVNTAPVGFLAPNTTNLPTPTIADPGLHFNSIIYNGDGTNGRALTGVGFQTDFNWIKKRSSAESHNLVDSVRGIGSNLASDTNAIQDAVSRITILGTDGFTVNNDARVNDSAQTYVSWNWKKSATSGFDIVKDVLVNTASQTISHSLGVKPDFIIGKFIDTPGSWIVYHSSLGATKHMILDTTTAVVTNANAWNNTEPTTTQITLGSSFQNASSFSGIFYAFAQVDGYSKFGSYIGNGSTDGPFVYCGFRPQYVMIKRTDVIDQWRIHDTIRNPGNGAGKYVNASNAAPEDDFGTTGIDILSNGFKPRVTNVPYNANGGTYIFATFAESPFKTATAR